MNWGVWPGFCASSAQVLQQNLPNWAFWPAPQGVCASPNQGWPVTCASTDQSWPGHQACASSSQEPLRPFAPRAQEPVREEEPNSEEWETTSSEISEQSHQETIIGPDVQIPTEDEEFQRYLKLPETRLKLQRAEEERQINRVQAQGRESPPKVYSSPRRRWKTSRYMVNDKYFGIITNVLGQPTTEVFADQKLHRLQEWWGPGSCHPNAWDMLWSHYAQGLLWINPPWEDLDWVVNKLLEDRGVAILVIPNWPREGWYRTAHQHAVKKYYIPKNEDVFVRVDGSSAGKTPWGVWAVKFDFKQDNGEEYPTVTGEEVWRESTRSSHRRALRKHKKQKKNGE